jgi:transcriptional regulator with PAS, ATPase and Fis domain
VKGSFTGATQDKKGYLELANNGTIFLDEIGEIDEVIQRKLLLVLDNKEYYPVGSTQAKKLSAKIILATNKNLQKYVNEGKFRLDLFYRIFAFQKELPPLRNSKKLRGLILETIEKYTEEYGKKLIIDSILLKKLCKYPWPGNYRELQKVCKYLVFFSENRIGLGDLPNWINLDNTASIDSKSALNNFNVYQEALESFEKRFFSYQLDKFKGKVNQTALETKVSKVTLIKKMKKYGLNRLDYGVQYSRSLL